tara:strand:+ start:1407 stop:1703 length:297 start_codon:yes stop_codon:yes gene_type:complete
MALTERTENDKIEIIHRWNIQVRTATVIEKDGVELTRSFMRKVIRPGRLKGGTGSDKDTLVPTDISGEDSDVQAICNAAWTAQVKTDFTAWMVANKQT